MTATRAIGTPQTNVRSHGCFSLPAKTWREVLVGRFLFCRSLTPTRRLVNGRMGIAFFRG
eukprot:7720808-Heterocapsa_arctica.AAC.1